MSKIIASAAIRGAHKIITRVEKKYKDVLEKYGPNQEIGFPDTAYYLPIIYGILGMKVEKPGDVEGALKDAFKRKDDLVFLDFAIDPTENVYPMVQGGKGLTEMILSEEL